MILCAHQQIIVSLMFDGPQPPDTPSADTYWIIRGSAAGGAAPAARFHIILVDF
jgi:hypothetical protein